MATFIGQARIPPPRPPVTSSHLPFDDQLQYRCNLGQAVHPAVRTCDAVSSRLEQLRTQSARPPRHQTGTTADQARAHPHSQRRTRPPIALKRPPSCSKHGRPLACR